MNLAQRGELVSVRVSECRCDGTPHPDGDVVYLFPTLTFDGGAAATAALRESVGTPDLDRVLGRSYLQHQVAGWNVVDDEGRAVPFALDALLNDWNLGRIVAERADELYSEDLLRPLVASVSTSSGRGLTDHLPPTSPRTPSTKPRRKR